jgi:hypothetical protein
MYIWASAHGLLHTVCTVYEILHGELSKDTEFHNMNIKAAYMTLLHLEKKGRVQLIKDALSPIEEYGVKFL